MKKPATVYDVTDKHGVRRLATDGGENGDGLCAVRWARQHSIGTFSAFPQVGTPTITEAEAVLWVAEGVLP